MKIVVTGSRGRVSNWDIKQLQIALAEQVELAGDPPTVIHGGCKNSPDESAGYIAENWDWPSKVYPADWEKHGKGAGFHRNFEMLFNEKPDLVLAQWDGKSAGTAHTISQATKLGIPVRILPPNV